MKTTAVAAFALALATSHAAKAASGYENRQTDHFGFTTVTLADNFSLKAVCTVSGGTVEARMDLVTRFIPDVGIDIGELLKTVTLGNGEALCGLKHYRGPSIASLPAKTNGFELDIRTWKDGKAIGGGAPFAACRRFLVNKSSMCYEHIGLGDNENRGQATGVSACIETEMPDSGTTLSIVVHAGQVPEEIAEQAASVETAVQETACAARTY